MPREAFERELQRLQDETLALESMVAAALTSSVDQLKSKDLEGSRELIAGDRAINRKRYQIEEDVLALIATQQPAAGDLRALRQTAVGTLQGALHLVGFDLDLEDDLTIGDAFGGNPHVLDYSTRVPSGGRNCRQRCRSPSPTAGC